MKGKHTIRLEVRAESIEITVKRKYTVIIGDSAIGKSFLFKSLSDMNDEVDCDVIVNPVDTVNGFDLAIESKGQIIIVDESLGIFKDMKKYRSLLRKSDNYFIFITRRHLVHLNYSVKEIYTLYKDNNTLRLKPYYDLSKKFKIENNGVIITEDSNTGNQFYRKVFNTCIVYPRYLESCGNWKVKQIYQKLYETGVIKHKNVYIIIDSAAFGCEMHELKAVIRNNRKDVGNVIISTPEAFEQLVCAAVVGAKDDRIINTYNYCEYNIYKSWEDYFEKLALKVYKGYNKKKYNDKILEIKEGIVEALFELG